MNKIISLMIILSMSIFFACGGGGSGSSPSGGGDTPYEYYPFEGSGSVGPDGGAVYVEGVEAGPTPFIDVPPGALTTEKTLTLTAIDAETEGISFYGHRDNMFVQFGPEGTQFEKPIIIGIPYHESLDPAKIQVYFRNELTNTWDTMPILAVDTENKFVLFETDHFSLYTVAGTNVTFDAELYTNGTNLFGAVRLTTPLADMPVDPSVGNIHDLIIEQPTNVRAAFRVSLKQSIAPIFDWFLPAVETKIITYTIPSADAGGYEVEARDENDAPLMNSMDHGGMLDMAGVEKHYSGEPLLFKFDMPANLTRKYYLTAELFYITAAGNIDENTVSGVWSDYGYKVTAYSSATKINFMDPVSDVDANGDGIVDKSGDGYTYDQVPVADITSPSTGASFAEETTVTLTGTAADDEDGTLTGTSLVWNSDKDGNLGSGNSLDIATLSINSHLITLTATDSAGNIGTASIILNVTAVPPVIVSRIPAINATGVKSEASVYVTFSKDMDASSFTDDSFILKDSKENEIDGTRSCTGKTAVFTPGSPLKKGEAFTVTITMAVKDTRGTALAASESWSFITESVFVPLEDAAYEHYGAGYFGGPTYRLAKEDGTPLQEGVDFIYDTDISNLCDGGVGGPMEAGKYIRIVENGVNVMNPSGLSLIPVAKNLTNWVSPPWNQVYVDPVRSKIALPRPEYWSKSESLDGIKTGEIGTAVVDNAPRQFVAGKYGNMAKNIGENLPDPYFGRCGFYSSRIAPNSVNPKKGTASFYAYTNSSAISGSYKFLAGGSCFFGGARTEGLVNNGPGPGGEDVYYVKNPGSCDGWGVGISNYSLADTPVFVLLFGNNVIGSYNVSANTLYHVYVVWDNDNNLANGKSIRVFLNGVERLSTTSNFSEINPGFTAVAGRFFYAVWDTQYNPPQPKGNVRIYGAGGVDNPKVWNHVVTENPAFDYGREASLHAVYGSMHDYQPDLSSTGSGLGYYYYNQTPPPSDRPAVPQNLLEVDSYHGTVELSWSGSVDTDGTVIGYNVYRSAISGSGYVQIDSVFDTHCYDNTLASFTDYYYIVKAVDDCGVESDSSNEIHVFLDPEIGVYCGSQEIASGGEYNVGGVMLRAKRKTQFTINNSGDISLTLNEPRVEITGPDAASFSMEQQPAGTVAMDGSSAFTIGFRPADIGTKTATVIVHSNDVNEGSYSFTVKGTGSYGKFDVGIYNPNSNGIFYTQYGDGTGAFGNETAYAWGNVPNAQMASGDFNGDGYFDLGIYNPADGSITIRYGDGHNNYSGQTVYTWSSGGKVFTGDFNRDGFWDVGLYDLNSDGVFRIRFGDGTGNFGSQAMYAWGHFTARNVQSFAGDFNGDGYFDIGLFNPQGDGRWFIRYNDGAMNFGGETVEQKWMLGGDDYIYPDATQGRYGYESSQNYSQIITGDFNSDGYWDIGIYHISFFHTGYWDWGVMWKPYVVYVNNGDFYCKLNNGDGSYSGLVYDYLGHSGDNRLRRSRLPYGSTVDSFYIERRIYSGNFNGD